MQGTEIQYLFLHTPNGWVGILKAVLIQAICQKVMFTKITLDHFQAHNVVLPPLYTWDLLGSRASAYKLQAGEPLHTLFQEWEMRGSIWESRLLLMGILELLGVEAVEYTIKVFTEFGSCHEVPLHLICEQLYLCQSLYTHSNGVAQDLSSKPYSHGSTCFLVRRQHNWMSCLLS